MAEIDTVAKRAKLEPRKNPYWQGVSGGRGGVSLGYRKGSGGGVWVAKIVLDGKRLEETIGAADDDRAAVGALRYRAAASAAIEWAERRAAAITAIGSGKAAGPTVRSAVLSYSAQRSQRSKRDGRNAEGRLAKHVLSDPVFADLPLSRLRASSVETWRGGLRRGEGPSALPLAQSTVNRLLNDIRAALNAETEKHRRELPAGIFDEIRIGTRAGRVEAEARKQLLTDGQVQALVAAAFEVDETGDFGRLVLLAAATGARFSQLAAMKVGSAQPARRRILVPSSQKGRKAANRPPVAVPLADEVLARLRPALADRSPEAPLLERWAYRQVGPFKWEREKRRAWGAAYEIDKHWSAACAKAEMPAGTIMYALRHSSIVRGLKAGLPVRLVASLHDTSVAMIEQHYSAFIVDMSEDLARRAALSLGAVS